MALKNFISIIIILVLISLYISTQDIISINKGIAWDAEVYYSMSTQIVNGDTPIKGIEPFIYRIGTPYIVAKLFPQNLVQGYLLYNLTIGFLTILLFYFFLRLFINNQLIILIFLVAYIINPLGVLRFTLLYPIYTDPTAILLSLLILYISIYFFKNKNWLITLSLSILSLIGVLFREIVILAPLSVLLTYIIIIIFHKKPSFEIIYRTIPVLASITGLALSHKLVEVYPSEYSFYSQAVLYMQANLQNPSRYISAILMTIGPIILLPIVLHRYIDISHKQLTLIIYMFGILLLSFIGGMHIDRFIFWGEIAYIPLIAIVVYNTNTNSILEKTLLFIPVLVAQLIAHRAFLPIPDMQTLNLSGPIINENIQFVLFSPYGEKISAIYTYAATMTQELRLQIIFQYFILFSYLMLVHQSIALIGPNQQSPCKPIK
ncbi:MAG: hypothetical protein ABFS56_27450 [Pseudomonadota bacterium]